MPFWHQIDNGRPPQIEVHGPLFGGDVYTAGYGMLIFLWFIGVSPFDLLPQSIDWLSVVLLTAGDMLC